MDEDAITRLWRIPDGFWRTPPELEEYQERRETRPFLSFAAIRKARQSLLGNRVTLAHDTQAMEHMNDYQG